MKWHYVPEGTTDKKETTEEELQELYKKGTVTKDTLVWNEGMPEWAPYSSILANDPSRLQDNIYAPSAVSTVKSSPSTNVKGDPALIKHLSSFLAENSKWIKFIGIVWFVMGILYCLTIIYAVFAWVFIWQGRILMQAADAINHANATGDQAAFEESQERISLAIKILGIVSLIGLILTAVMILIWLVILIVGVATGGFAA